MFQIVMDPMRALASLEFVSARGLDTADLGPTILANQVLVTFVMMILMIRWAYLIIVQSRSECKIFK